MEHSRACQSRGGNGKAVDVGRRNRAIRGLASVAVCALGLYVAAQVSFAPATFQEGQVVSAEEFNDLLNDNFTAAAVAIATKQARVTGSCEAGFAVRVVNADGSVECQAIGGIVPPYSVSAFVGSTESLLTLDAAYGRSALHATNDSGPALTVGPSGTGLLITDPEDAGIRIEGASAVGLVVEDAVNDGVRIDALLHGVRIDGGVFGVRVDMASSIGVDASSADIGGWFRGVNSGAIVEASDASAPDLVLGGTSADPGRIVTSVDTSTDLYLSAHGDVVITLDMNDDDAANFLVSNGDGEAVFHVLENGNAFLDGVLTENSDVGSKHVVSGVDPTAVLAAVAELPISYWSYLDAPGVTHIGPMAQDFYRLFDVGADDDAISTIDRDGVALAAIQGLRELVLDQQEQIRALEARLAAIESRR